MIRAMILVTIVLLFSFCNNKTLKVIETSEIIEKTKEDIINIDTVVIEEATGAIEVTKSHKAPEMLRAIKPIYSMDMIDGEVEGSVKLRILVGTDGLIKKYVILNDLGFGTNKAIHNALLKTTFTSAKKDGKRIPVWIETTLNFKLPNINL